MAQLTASSTVYVATWWYRDCDPLASVAGFDAKVVAAKAKACMEDQLERDADEDDGTFPLMDSLCWSGVNAWAGKEAMQGGALGIPAENIAELEQDGITIY